jgi:hypothetical protein
VRGVDEAYGRRGVKGCVQGTEVAEVNMRFKLRQQEDRVCV